MFIIYDMILAALLCGVVMYLHPGWYDLCLENFAKLLQLLDIPIDCYDVYCRASEEKNVYSKRVFSLCSFSSNKHNYSLLVCNL